MTSDEVELKFILLKLIFDQIIFHLLVRLRSSGENTFLIPFNMVEYCCKGLTISLANIIFSTHCRQSDAVTVSLSLPRSVAVILDQVNVKVDRAVEYRHQVRQLSDALDEGGKLYVKLKRNVIHDVYL